jgi:hypothetical protein
MIFLMNDIVGESSNGRATILPGKKQLKFFYFLKINIKNKSYQS